MQNAQRVIRLRDPLHSDDLGAIGEAPAVFLQISQNSTVKFGRGPVSIVEQVLPDPAVHTRPLGDSWVERMIATKHAK